MTKSVCQTYIPLKITYVDQNCGPWARKNKTKKHFFSALKKLLTYKNSCNFGMQWIEGLITFFHDLTACLGWRWSDRITWVRVWIETAQIFHRKSFKIWSKETGLVDPSSNGARPKRIAGHARSPDGAHEPLHRPISALRPNALQIDDQNGTAEATFTQKRGLNLSRTYSFHEHTIELHHSFKTGIAFFLRKFS